VRLLAAFKKHDEEIGDYIVNGYYDGEKLLVLMSDEPRCHVIMTATFAEDNLRNDMDCEQATLRRGAEMLPQLKEKVR
jgi:hypothetical protein